VRGLSQDLGKFSLELVPTDGVCNGADREGIRRNRGKMRSHSSWISTTKSSLQLLQPVGG
jgi:hypothetical protein